MANRPKELAQCNTFMPRMNSVLGNFLVGISYTWRGLRLIGHPGLRGYVALPIFINTALFSIGIIWLTHTFSSLMQHYIPHWLLWLEWILWPLIALGFGIGLFYTFTLAGNLIAAPFTGLLAEQIERRLGTHPPTTGANLLEYVKTGLIGMRTQVLTLAYMLAWAAPLFLMGFVPGLAFLLAPLWFLFSAWMLALGYLAIPTGNHAFDFHQLRQLAHQHRSLMLGLGSGITILTMIPVLNFLVLPSGTAAATLLWCERLKSTLSINNVTDNQ